MLGIVILAALVKLNLELEQPAVPAAIYGAVGIIFGLLFGATLPVSLIAGVINFAIGFVLFFALKRTEGTSAWWPTAIIGILGIFALNFLF